MKVRGFWMNDRPFFHVEITLPDGFRRTLRLEVDTGATRTMIAEREFPPSSLSKFAFDTRSIDTLVGRMSAKVVPDCRIRIDDGQNHYTVKRPIYFIPEKRPSPAELKVLRKVLAPDFRDRIEPARNLLGIDVLGTNLLLAKRPSLLVLTDEYPALLPLIEKQLSIRPTM